MIAVGIGNEIDINELTAIASPPDAQTTQTVYTVQGKATQMDLFEDGYFFKN